MWFKVIGSVNLPQTQSIDKRFYTLMYCRTCSETGQTQHSTVRYNGTARYGIMALHGTVRHSRFSPVLFQHFNHYWTCLFFWHHTYTCFSAFVVRYTYITFFLLERKNSIVKVNNKKSIYILIKKIMTPKDRRSTNNIIRLKYTNKNFNLPDTSFHINGYHPQWD